MRNKTKRNRSAETGQFVSETIKDANLSNTITETTNYADRFLRKLTKNGGVIVSIKDMTQAEFALAEKEKRVYYDQDGLGYAWLSPEQE